MLNNCVRDKVRTNVWGSVSYRIRTLVTDRVWYQIERQFWSSAINEIVNQTDDQVWSEIKEDTHVG